MCFSFEADLTAAAVLTPLGVYTLRAAKTRSQLAVASIPLFFAAHQGVEALVWLGTDGHASAAVESFATYLYLVMAQMILPVLVPLAVAAIEHDRRKRIYMIVSAIGGAYVTFRFGWILVSEGATAYPLDRTMVYKTPTDMGPLGGIMYLNATVITTIVASGKYLKLFGAANAIGISMAGWLRWEAVTSVWCIYAAMISGLILLHLKMVEDERRGGDADRRRGSVPAADGTDPRQAHGPPAAIASSGASVPPGG